MSAVWKYFKISAEDNSKAECSLCGAMLSRSGKNLKTYETSTLLKHLPLKHSENSESNVVYLQIVTMLLLKPGLWSRSRSRSRSRGVLVF